MPASYADFELQEQCPKRGRFLTKLGLGQQLAQNLVEVSSIYASFLGSLLLGGVMAMPAVVRAADEHERHQANRAERYYDKDAKTYHEWNDQEERAYRHWWEGRQHNAAAHDSNRLSNRERQQYWHWRHQHPEAY